LLNKCYDLRRNKVILAPVESVFGDWYEKLLSPEEVDARAKKRQAQQLARYGGREAVNARGDLGFSPPPGIKAEVKRVPRPPAGRDSAYARADGHNSSSCRGYADPT
jgi:hypothetical protein